MANEFTNISDNIDDNIAFIFTNMLDLKDAIISKRSFNTALKDIDEANDYYAKVWESLSKDSELIYKASVVFNELFMNAYEHGNLSINTKEKHTLIEEDRYFTTLLELEQDCSKKIVVTISKVKLNSSVYIITKIEDEGNGFDTQMLSSIFKDINSFNGRGIFVSKSLSLGIYYNERGNSVVFLYKI